MCVLILIVVEDGLVHMTMCKIGLNPQVLILIVVEDGLVPNRSSFEQECQHCVLILIVVEDGLVHKQIMITLHFTVCLNPYCSGRWSRTNGA